MAFILFLHQKQTKEFTTEVYFVLVHVLICFHPLPLIFIWMSSQMEQMREKMRQEANAETKQSSKNKENDEMASDDWTEDQTQLLIKAVNLFPAGTASRYYVNSLNVT